MAHVLFDASEAIGLYGKPMARNAQLWTDGRPPVARRPLGHPRPDRAGRAGDRGGRGVRLPLPVPRHARRPARSLLASPPGHVSPPGPDRPVVVPDAPLGVLTASPADRPRSRAIVELWPEILARPPYVAAATLFRHAGDPHAQQTARNCRKLLVAQAALGGRPLPRSFARRLLTLPERQTLDEWLDALPARPTTRPGALAGRRIAPVPRTRVGRRGHTGITDLRAHGAKDVRGRLLERHGHAFRRPLPEPEQRRLRPRFGHPKSTQAPGSRPRAPGRLPPGAPSPGDRRRGDAGTCTGGRSAVPLAHRLRVHVVGRLAPESRGRSPGCSAAAGKRRISRCQ